MCSSVVQLPRLTYSDRITTQQISEGFRKFQEVSKRVKKSQEAWGLIKKGSRSIMKHRKLSRSLSLRSCTTLLVMDCLVYIAAAAGMANPMFFTVLVTSLGPRPQSSTPCQQTFPCCTICFVWLALWAREISLLGGEVSNQNAPGVK